MSTCEKCSHSPGCRAPRQAPDEAGTCTFRGRAAEGPRHVDAALLFPSSLVLVLLVLWDVCTLRGVT